MTCHKYWLLPTLALAAGCSSQSDEPAKTVQLTFHEVMKDLVDKNADELWEMSNAVTGEESAIDPSKMDDAKWTAFADRADAVTQAAQMIVSMDPIVVVKPGVKISDEGEPGAPTAAMVQARVDKDRQHLRDMAQSLASHTTDLSMALRAHDAVKSGPLIDQLDGVCESCHLEYWYPAQ